MDKKLEIHSWFTYNNYFKGSLDNLEIWNNGEITFFETKIIDLYDCKGNFYKKEESKVFYNLKKNINISKYCTLKKQIIQIDYDFYLVPITERLNIQDGRNKLKNLLKNYGITGLNNYRGYFRRKYHYTYKKPRYEVERPIEVVFLEEHRTNTKKFIEFNYDKYISNYKKALLKFPDYKDEINYLKDINISVICDFYDIEEKELKRKDFDRLKHAIKILNRKINNN